MNSIWKLSRLSLKRLMEVDERDAHLRADLSDFGKDFGFEYRAANAPSVAKDGGGQSEIEFGR